MRVVGIDPSSTYCGVGVIDTPDLVMHVTHWERDKNRSHPQGFEDYYDWLMLRLFFWKPHMAVIEMGSYAAGGAGGKGNFQAVQAVSFYQSISALACKKCGLLVVETRVTSARKAVLGNGALSKDQTWAIMRERYPKLFSFKNRGGLDEMDGLVLALAGARVAER
jgi:Holliday junction resolvasome RuvABC endonuclease subunit